MFRLFDTTHLALITQALYFYCVSNFANPAALGEFPMYVPLDYAILSDLILLFCIAHSR